MAVKEKPTESAFKHFLVNGGTVTFEIEPEDIDSTREFETSVIIQPKLKTGFELRPFAGSYTDPKGVATMIFYGGDWDTFGRQVYSRGGEIWYKQLPSGNYEATCTIPPRRTIPTVQDSPS